MQADDLLNMIQSPATMDTTAVAELHKAIETCPYFQLAYTLLAKHAYDQDPTKALHTIQVASIYAPDRNHLKRLLENQLGDAKLIKSSPKARSHHAQPTVQKTTEGSATGATTKPLDVVAIAARTKEVTDKLISGQWHAIDKFITQPPLKLKLKPEDELLLHAQSKDLTEENLGWHRTLLTETLAQIMLRQAKFDKAIEIYSILKDKFPEKSTYFEHLIAEVPKSYKTHNPNKSLTTQEP